MNRVVIGLGSNIDPDENIAKARESIAAEFRLLDESRWVETKPVGFSKQANFINGALLIETRLDPSTGLAPLNRPDRISLI